MPISGHETGSSPVFAFPGLGGLKLTLDVHSVLPQLPS
jgi:hypothetical protein